MAAYPKNFRSRVDYSTEPNLIKIMVFRVSSVSLVYFIFKFLIQKITDFHKKKRKR